MSNSTPRLGNPYPLKMERDVETKIHMLMEKQGETKAEIMRRCLRRGVELEMLEDNIDPLVSLVRKALFDVQKPMEERLAKITAKASIAAATSMYSNLEVLGHLGKDIRAIHELSRKKAVAFVKQPNEKQMGESEDE